MSLPFLLQTNLKMKGKGYKGWYAVDLAVNGEWKEVSKKPIFRKLLQISKNSLTWSFCTLMRMILELLIFLSAGLFCTPTSKTTQPRTLNQQGPFKAKSARHIHNKL